MTRRVVRFAPFLPALLLAGCGGTPAAHSPATSPTPAAAGEIDYKGWPAVTEKPVRIAPHIFWMCYIGPDLLKEMDRRGPHFQPVVKVVANKEAHAAIKEKKTAAMPVGSVIVKEKFWDEKQAKPTAYAAMIKREAGYDAENGDWEYVYVTLGDEKKAERGKMKSCADCHANARGTDRLFLQYDDYPPAKKD
jgi:hypothetical protein